MKFNILKCGNCGKNQLFRGSTFGRECTCGHLVYLDDEQSRAYVKIVIEKQLMPFCDSVEEFQAREKLMMEKYHFVLPKTYTKTDKEIIAFLNEEIKQDIPMKWHYVCEKGINGECKLKCETYTKETISATHGCPKSHFNQTADWMNMGLKPSPYDLIEDYKSCKTCMWDNDCSGNTSGISPCPDYHDKIICPKCSEEMYFETYTDDSLKRYLICGECGNEIHEIEVPIKCSTYNGKGTFLCDKEDPSTQVECEDCKGIGYIEGKKQGDE